MLKVIKKSILIFMIITIDVIVYLSKIIYKFYRKNKSKFKNYSKGFYYVLKEELQK